MQHATKIHVNIVNYLLNQEGIDSCALDESKKTPLHLCSESGSEEAALALLQHEERTVDVNARDINGVSPIFTCILNHNFNIANHLLLAGADINLKKCDGMTVLHSCMVSGDVEALTFLLELPEKHHLMLNARDEFGDTPLFKAVSHSGRTKAIRLLLSSGNNNVGTWIRNNVGENIFHLLSKTGNVNLLYFLIDILPIYSSNMSSSTNTPVTPLQQLETHIRSACIEDESGPNDLEPLSPMGVLLSPSPAAASTQSSQLGFMSRFIQNRKTASNATEAQPTCVDVKIQHLLNERDKSGYTPLHVAVKFDQADLVKALLSLKARDQPNQTDAEVKLEKRRSFRKSFAQGTTTSTSTKLYDALNVNQTDHKSNTALHLAISAVESGKARSGPQIIKALMAVKNIKTDIKNSAGDTAKSHAKKCNVSLK
ncbi:ankyrin repeat and protein kinase domain-containing protein [Acrasis kona]|uniref:Ankyrin repeat and protein kinase domain-containing protein n=1 Tax=Acrasis kona TaxID=1008807 RepID=A0AAW2ZCY6_9EUKA